MVVISWFINHPSLETSLTSPKLVPDTHGYPCGFYGRPNFRSSYPNNLNLLPEMEDVTEMQSRRIGLVRAVNLWGFPEMVTPIGWFMENLIQVDDDWGYPHFRKPPYIFLGYLQLGLDDSVCFPNGKSTIWGIYI
jgi:hypothetical protein